jgi:uncharacterized OsmC-like protein
MGAAELAAALERAERVLARRPTAGLHDDSPAIARWRSGVRVVTSNPEGVAVETDMPIEMGGSGDRATPGWMVRAGLAACTTTSIAMKAAREGVRLEALAVEVTSRSDMRGVLHMSEDEGGFVYPGPQALALAVRIFAPGVAPERLRALVDQATAASPMMRALEDPHAVELRVEVAG